MNNTENIKFKLLTEAEYNNIENTIVEEKQKNENNYVNFSDYSKNLLGIFMNNILVGLIRIQDFIKGKSVDYYVLPAYRGNNIAGIALDKLTEKINTFYPDCEDFYINIDPNNTSSLRVIEKLGWQENHSLDEIMIEEGTEFFLIYKMEHRKGIKLTREKNSKITF